MQCAYSFWTGFTKIFQINWLIQTYLCATHYVGNIIANGIKNGQSFVPVGSMIYFKSYKIKNNRKNILSAFLKLKSSKRIKQIFKSINAFLDKMPCLTKIILLFSWKLIIYIFFTNAFNNNFCIFFIFLVPKKKVLRSFNFKKNIHIVSIDKRIG